MYIYQENQRVYFTNGETHPFVPLYDFGAGIGEKFTTFTWDFNYSATFLVTAVETITVGSQTFKVQYIEPDSGNLELGNKVVEFVGGRTLFPQIGFCDPVLGTLFCYNNGSFGYPSYPCGVVGTAEINAAPAVQIIPNPVHDFFDLYLTDWPSPTIPVQISDLQGKIVFSKTLVAENPANKINLDATNWPAGLYFVKIGPVLSRKIVVQH